MKIKDPFKNCRKELSKIPNFKTGKISVIAICGERLLTALLKDMECYKKQ